MNELRPCLSPKNAWLVRHAFLPFCVAVALLAGVHVSEAGESERGEEGFRFGAPVDVDQKEWEAIGNNEVWITIYKGRTPGLVSRWMRQDEHRVTRLFHRNCLIGQIGGGSLFALGYGRYLFPWWRTDAVIGMGLDASGVAGSFQLKSGWFWEASPMLRPYVGVSAVVAALANGRFPVSIGGHGGVEYHVFYGADFLALFFDAAYFVPVTEADSPLPVRLGLGMRVSY